MLAEFTAWLLSLVVRFFSTLWDFVTDAFVNVLDMYLSALVGLFGLIPVPAFMADGLQSFFSALDPGIVYFANSTGLFAGLGMVGAAYVFKLSRKVVTMFKW
jgi:hypothetical protein